MDRTDLRLGFNSTSGTSQQEVKNDMCFFAVSDIANFLLGNLWISELSIMKCIYAKNFVEKCPLFCSIIQNIYFPRYYEHLVTLVRNFWPCRIRLMFPQGVLVNSVKWLLWSLLFWLIRQIRLNFKHWKVDKLSWFSMLLVLKAFSRKYFYCDYLNFCHAAPVK